MMQTLKLKDKTIKVILLLPVLLCVTLCYSVLLCATLGSSV